MLKIIIENEELFNEETNTFENLEGGIFDLEHSLISLSKWESKYQKPFLSSDDKTSEEFFGYIKCMVLNDNASLDDFYRISETDIIRIQEYIDSSQSATTFGSMPNRYGPSEIITSELIYYWMVAFNIPFECQNWHLNRLFALIRICNIKNSPPEQMSRAELAQRNQELNAQRRAQLGTKG
jgi:hypothetical protein